MLREEKSLQTWKPGNGNEKSQALGELSISIDYSIRIQMLGSLLPLSLIATLIGNIAAWGATNGTLELGIKPLSYVR
jgi:hypothetical protein